MTSNEVLEAVTSEAVDVINEHAAELKRLRATIERVRAVMNNYREWIDYDSFLATDVRAALEGERS